MTVKYQVVLQDKGRPSGPQRDWLSQLSPGREQIEFNSRTLEILRRPATCRVRGEGVTHDSLEYRILPTPPQSTKSTYMINHLFLRFTEELNAL